MTDKIDISKCEDFLLNLLPRAGQILRNYFHAENLFKKKKGKLDFVTAADLAVDEFIRMELTEKFPGIPILTEETAPIDFRKRRIHDFVVRGKLKERDLLWIVDPLDGTANFSRGDANYSISIALVNRGDPLIGALFVPVSNKLFWARIDKVGAYWNSRRIYVSQTTDLSEAIVCTDWSHIISTRNQTTNFLKRIFGSVRQIKILGSAASDISLLARGGVDIYHHVHLMPWDVAAASLIAKNAGAVITDLDGNSWNVFTPGIIAGNPRIHARLLKLLKS